MLTKRLEQVRRSGKLEYVLCLVFPLYARGQRCRPGTAAHAGTAGIHVPSDPAFPPDHAIFHYSDSNIPEKTLPECLRSPMFMAYHDGQPFNDNMLRPCPMLENPEKLRAMVAGTEAHSTDMQSPESAEHLCAKCETYAANRTPTADKLWRCCDGGIPEKNRI